jgi:hypothetical protein
MSNKQFWYDLADRCKDTRYITPNGTINNVELSQINRFLTEKIFDCSSANKEWLRALVPILPRYSASLTEIVGLIENDLTQTILEARRQYFTDTKNWLVDWVVKNHAYTDQGAYVEDKAMAWIYDPVLTPPKWKCIADTPALALCGAYCLAKGDLTND